MKKLSCENVSKWLLDQIYVCEHCLNVYDCRQIKNQTAIENDQLELSSMRCQECHQSLFEATDPSLNSDEKAFVEQRLGRLESETTKSPSYICLQCGVLNTWDTSEKPWYFLTSKPDIGVYPHCENEQRKNYLEERSLAGATWSFSDDCIVATPSHQLIKEFNGDFTISLTEKRLYFGPENKRQRWDLDDSWVLDTQEFSIGFTLFTKHTYGDSANPVSYRVRLYSKKYHIAFLLHGGGKYACKDFEKRLGNSLKYTLNSQ
ncbi:hypothetical protein BVX99_02365 [bacterium F16]|nr:hypothetical protein BVX99_02365 [bacterium F16]